MNINKPKIALSGPNLTLWYLLGIVLMTLRALHIIECSWWVAISPFYIPMLMFYAFAVMLCRNFRLNGEKQEKTQLGFKRLVPEAKLPRYAHEGDAGMDVVALEDVDLLYGRPTLVHTGIAAEIPNGYEIQVRPRSGLALKGVTVWNSPGTIDSKYRGEIGVVMLFMTHYDQVTDVAPGMSSSRDMPVSRFKIHKGDKIAQLVLSPVTFANPVEVQSLTVTERGTAGFGSTGV